MKPGQCRPFYSECCTLLLFPFFIRLHCIKLLVDPYMFCCCIESTPVCFVCFSRSLIFTFQCHQSHPCSCPHSHPWGVKQEPGKPNLLLRERNAPLIVKASELDLAEYEECISLKLVNLQMSGLQSKHCHSKRVQETYFARMCFHYIRCVSRITSAQMMLEIYHTEILYGHLHTTFAFVTLYGLSLLLEASFYLRRLIGTKWGQPLSFTYSGFPGLLNFDGVKLSVCHCTMIVP